MGKSEDAAKVGTCADAAKPLVRDASHVGRIASHQGKPSRTRAFPWEFCTFTFSLQPMLATAESW